MVREIVLSITNIKIDFFCFIWLNYTSIRKARGTTLNILARIISPFGKVNSSGWVRKLYNNSLLRNVGFDNKCYKTINKIFRRRLKFLLVKNVQNPL
jgi:hypothetical protein